jgi:hypothetical protein
VTTRVAVLPALVFAARFTPRAWRRAPVFILAAGAGIGLRALAGRAGLLPAASAVLAAVLLLVAAAALYRLALRDRGLPPPGALAGSAMRLAAAQGLLAALTLIVGAILLVVLLALAYAVASTGAGFAADDPETWARAAQGRGRWVLGGALAAAAVALAWIHLRLSLASAATIARGRVQALSAWPLTRGAVLPILVAVVAVNALPATALIVAARWLTGAWHAAAAAAVIALVMLPLNVGLMSYLYGEATSGAGPTA